MHYPEINQVFYKIFRNVLAHLLLPVFITMSAVPAAALPERNLVRMQIPRLNLDITVKKVPFSEESGTWDITEETGAAYWLEGTPHPDYGGNTVIAAHYMEYGEPGPLFRIRDLQERDEIYLYSETARYTYRVVQLRYIPYSYTEYLNNRPYALTLFTCSGFNWDTGVWEQRVVILAELVQIDISESAALPSHHFQPV